MVHAFLKHKTHTHLDAARLDAGVGEVGREELEVDGAVRLGVAAVSTAFTTATRAPTWFGFCFVFGDLCVCVVHDVVWCQTSASKQKQ